MVRGGRRGSNESGHEQLGEQEVAYQDQISC